MNWFLKLIGVDAAIRELKEELLLEIKDARRSLTDHTYSDIAHGDLTSQRKELFPRLVPYVLEQIDKGKIRTWEQYTDWHHIDHTKAVNWSNRISTISSTEEHACWIVEATKFAGIKLPVDPSADSCVGLINRGGPGVISQEAGCTSGTCPQPPGNTCAGCKSADKLPWDYDDYPSSFLDTLINRSDSNLAGWLAAIEESEDALEDPDDVDSSTTDS